MEHGVWNPSIQAYGVLMCADGQERCILKYIKGDVVLYDCELWTDFFFLFTTRTRPRETQVEKKSAGVAVLVKEGEKKNKVSLVMQNDFNGLLL